MTKITIIPLGTVSPYCKDEHNCPGFLVLYKNQKILLDCGNGITRYMDFPSGLENLNVIITHYHKDHYGDMGVLQYASYVYHNLGLLNKKINVYLPKEDFNYSKVEILENKEAFCDYYDIFGGLVFYLEDLKISLEDNKSHTIPSLMVKLENENSKIVYTSDIGPTNWQNLVEFSSNSDLLICESSFLRRHNSLSKMHMTAYAAGLLAQSSNSKKLLLTHLWPEEKREDYLSEAQENFSNTEVALEKKKLELVKR